jgi:hypothetical protein
MKYQSIINIRMINIIILSVYFSYIKYKIKIIFVTFPVFLMRKRTSVIDNHHLLAEVKEKLGMT